jgi:outer membrane receptor protein involved in Fe transport
VIEYPPQSLDFTLSYGLNRNTRFKLSAENLLNDRVEFRQRGLISQAYETGTTIGLSVSYNTESK